MLYLILCTFEVSDIRGIGMKVFASAEKAEAFYLDQRWGLWAVVALKPLFVFLNEALVALKPFFFQNFLQLHDHSSESQAQ